MLVLAGASWRWFWLVPVLAGTGHGWRWPPGAGRTIMSSSWLVLVAGWCRSWLEVVLAGTGSAWCWCWLVHVLAGAGVDAVLV